MSSGLGFNSLQNIPKLLRDFVITINEKVSIFLLKDEAFPTKIYHLVDPISVINLLVFIA